MGRLFVESSEPAPVIRRRVDWLHGLHPKSVWTKARPENHGRFVGNSGLTATEPGVGTVRRKARIKPTARNDDGPSQKSSRGDWI
jgi:hypothetical protein